MTREQFRDERAYLSALAVLDALRGKGLVTTDEYQRALAVLDERFRPVFDAALLVSGS